MSPLRWGHGNREENRATFDQSMKHKVVNNSIKVEHIYRQMNLGTLCI